MRQTRLIGCALLLAVSAAASAREVWERPWVEVRSEHFVIASALSEDRAVALAVELENFRSAVDLLTGAAAVNEPIPTKIYVLPRAERALGFDGKFIGYFRPGMRANYAVMIPEAGTNSAETLKHEYTHYLIRNRDQRRYPPWIEEGLSEMFATLRIDGPVLDYGRAPEGRLDSLLYGRWLPFEDVVAARETASMSRSIGPMFYAQSWLLVHYLMLGRPGATFAAETAEYVDGLGAGTPAVEVFETVFETEVDALNQKLADYGRRIGYYRMSLKSPLPTPTLTSREMPVDEVAAQIGLLALLRGNYESAAEFYEAALEENPDNTVALVGSADLHKFADRYDEAGPLYERALALEPDDAGHLLDYGEYFLDRARAEQSPEARRQFIVEARRRFARSYQIDPNNPETLDQNGLTYLFEGEDVHKGLESLELAHALLPSQEDIQIHLAQAYLVGGKSDRARELLADLLAISHTARAEQIAELLASLEGKALEGQPEAAGL